MMIEPDPARLEGVSTDPHNGGPYVMWPEHALCAHHDPGRPADGHGRAPLELKPLPVGRGIAQRTRGPPKGRGGGGLRSRRGSCA